LSAGRAVHDACPGGGTHPALGAHAALRPGGERRPRPSHLVRIGRRDAHRLGCGPDRRPGRRGRARRPRVRQRRAARDALSRPAARRRARRVVRHALAPLRPLAAGRDPRRPAADRSAAGRQCRPLRGRQQRPQAARRSVPGARVPPGLGALPPGGVGREHPPQAADPREHLPEAFRSVGEPPDRGARVDHHRAHRRRDPDPVRARPGGSAIARRMPPPLAGLRALDLTDAPGYLCGRLLADLGVLVIKVEPPGGDAGRALAPRYRAPDGREQGLYWHATNAGKLGVTLALEHAEAPRLLAELAARADFVLDSFPPDSAPARLVAEIAAARPVLVHTSVTPFGDRPPGRALHADDVVIAATGGSMYLCGDEDRPPVRLPLWQAFCHAGAEAAVGTLLAHLARGRSGRGQHVVVSAQAAMVRIEEAVAAFLRTRTKAEVYREGVRRRILVAPVATVADIVADPQLAFRDYFRPVDDAALGRRVRYPGPFARLSATPLAEPRRPPEPGEHNRHVWGELCGYDVEALGREGII